MFFAGFCWVLLGFTVYFKSWVGFFQFIFSFFFLLNILGIVSMILVRTLRRDIAKYNKEDEMVGIKF